jgi:hypothetical protein
VGGRNAIHFLATVVLLFFCHFSVWPLLLRRLGSPPTAVSTFVVVSDCDSRIVSRDKKTIIHLIKRLSFVQLEDSTRDNEYRTSWVRSFFANVFFSH